jgi:hypothetical protein
MTIPYGYQENFQLDVPPVSREGAVTITYQLANNGGLAFAETLHAGLYLVGQAEPLQVIERSYHLYPGQPAITDTLDFGLIPGNYLLTYHTGKIAGTEIPFTVIPAGIGLITLSGGHRYPLGRNELAYTLQNSDSVAGHIPVTLTLNRAGAPVPLISDVRTYYLLPGQAVSDVLAVDFADRGDYMVFIGGDKVSVPIQQMLAVVPLKETAATITIDPAVGDRIPVNLAVQNTGFQPFAGSLVIEVAGRTQEESISVPPGNVLTQTFGFSTAGLLPGEKSVKASLVAASGESLQEVTATVAISGADIRVSQLPADLEIGAGEFTAVTLKLKNEGHLPGEASLSLQAFDTLNQERAVLLQAGEEIAIGDIIIEAAADLPAGLYPLHYTLTGSGVKNGVFSGNWHFRVNGIRLDVSASLDQSLYDVGDTAMLTITVAAGGTVALPLEAVVNWGDFSDKKTFTAGPGPAQLEFSLPLTEQREGKIFYGIYHEGGKGIHLNDIYLNFRGPVSVELDQQVYAPGQVVHAVFSAETPGSLTVQCFNDTQTISLSSSAMAELMVPAATLGGSYALAWEFIPAGGGETLSGSRPFDVSGLQVKTARSDLSKGRYAPGESIPVSLTFESNQDTNCALNSWLVKPSGQWVSLGETSITLSASEKTEALASYLLETAEAGTHHLVYGLYTQGERLLAVSGSLAFAVGDAVLIGLATDRAVYLTGQEDVLVQIDYSGQGAANLDLFLAGQPVHRESLEMSGPGRKEIVITPDRLSGGQHLLSAVLEKGGLTSQKETSFTYGADLPDLSLSLQNASPDGLHYTFNLAVKNSGKTASPSFGLDFSVNGSQADDQVIPGLAAGQELDVRFDWDGRGQAGTHELLFQVDAAHAVKEYNEDNNQVAMSLEVPRLFSTLTIEPMSWPARTAVKILTRLINNQAEGLSLVLDLGIAPAAGGAAIFQVSRTEELAGFATRTLIDLFDTGVYPAGEYIVRQKLAGSGVDKLLAADVLIEETHSVTVGLTLTPGVIQAGSETPVQAAINIENTGNAGLQEEPLLIEIKDKEGDEVVQVEELALTLGISQSQALTRPLVLNLREGTYRVIVKVFGREAGGADLSVLPAVEQEKRIAVRPRVLVMGIDMSKAGLLAAGFIHGLLQSQGLEVRAASGLEPAYIAYHSNETNVTVALAGPLFGLELAAEMKERVWAGEGLILVCSHPLLNPELADWLGVRVEAVPARRGQQVIEVLPGSLGPGAEIILAEKHRLRLVKIKEDVEVIARTRVNREAVICTRRYGQGQVLVIGLPLLFSSGTEVFGPLLGRAAGQFSRDVYSPSDLSRVLPLELVLKNRGSSERDLLVKEGLPDGCLGYGYEPQPEPGDDPSFKIKLLAGEEKRLFYWLKLPDEIKHYEVKSEVFAGEKKLFETSLGLEVTQTVIGRIDELLVEIAALDAGGPDRRYRQQALAHLQDIRNRTGAGRLAALANLHDAVKAASALGQIVAPAAAPLRRQTIHLLLSLSRTLYDLPRPGHFGE